jgi:hypothetical protein
MPDTLDASQFDLPAGALISAFAADYGADTRSRLIARVQEHIDHGRAEQRKWNHRFDQLYEEARQKNWSEPFLIQWALALLEKQRAALELFHPLIEGLQRRATDYAAVSDADLLKLCLATIDLALGWIRPYQKLCGQVLELAAERRNRGDQIFRARPVEGEIDHSALSHEIIVRFPNILAELAK